MRKLLLLTALIILAGCQSTSDIQKTGSPELLVAAASNLTDVFTEAGALFTLQTGIRVVFSFGSTADLAKQIENGAPFDVFASADTAHVEQLERKGLLTPGSRAIYARGRLVMWLPSGSNLKAARVEDIRDKGFERIAVAKPDVAPYGQATVESLQVLGLWQEIEPRVVYAQNVSQAKQYAATGNAEVAFIPLALVKPGEGNYIEIEERLHQPINQALGIVKDSVRQDAARKFVSFLMGAEGQELLSRSGYNKPASP